MPLPIEPHLPHIVESLRAHQNLVIEAPPGSGKTTRVPEVILEQLCVPEQEVWVLEPRRLAALLAARRIADQRGESVGDIVGYQVRYETMVSKRTRLRFLTEGTFQRLILSNPELSRVAFVVIDEIHERHLSGDLALALLRRLQKTRRPDLKLVLMSATLDAAACSQYLDNCPRIVCSGSYFPVSVSYRDDGAAVPLAQKVKGGVSQLLTSQRCQGDLLVFLPGVREIRDSLTACSVIPQASGCELVALYGEIDARDRERALTKSVRQKIIFATNVAESSVTIDGVSAVVDSGLHRAVRYSEWTGLPSSAIERVSQASAIQRAGRAGRQGPGVCLRLYAESDFQMRAAYGEPEILRADLCEMVLQLAALGVSYADDDESLQWLDRPPQSALVHACTLLVGLGALDPSGQITERGRQMSRFPLHPRLSAMIVGASSESDRALGCLLGALLSEREIRTRGDTSANDIDFRTSIDLFCEAESGNFNPKLAQSLGIESGAVAAVERVRQRLLKLAEVSSMAGVFETASWGDRAGVVCLQGFFDRVAHRDPHSPNEVKLMDGMRAVFPRRAGAVSRHSLEETEFLIVLDLEMQRLNRRTSTQTVVRRVLPVSADYLLDSYSHAVQSKVDLHWNDEQQRIELYDCLMYGALPLVRSRLADGHAEACSELLRRELERAGGLEFLGVGLEIAQLQTRISFFLKFCQGTEVSIEELEMVLMEALKNFVEGQTSLRVLAELAQKGTLSHYLLDQYPESVRRQLDKACPTHISLPGRKSVAVNYKLGQPAWIESRIQDFFGLSQTPAIAEGKMPLVLHLLAPNYRAIQVTQDLSGFWKRDYPAVRRELSRRYPRHRWPEDPHRIG